MDLAKLIQWTQNAFVFFGIILAFVVFMGIVVAVSKGVV